MADDYEYGKDAFGNPNLNPNQFNRDQMQGWIAERDRQAWEQQVKDANDASNRKPNGE